jgi:DNA adenine methylase
MAQVLADLKGGFILSLNDHPEVRRIFGAFAMVRLELLYSISEGNPTEAAELIISSLPAERLAELFPKGQLVQASP